MTMKLEKLTEWGSRENFPSIKTSCKSRGMKFGFAVEPLDLVMPGRMQRLRREANHLVAENIFKWHNVNPSARGVFQWEAVDNMLGWAKVRGMTMRWHTVMWHGGVPPWLAAALTSENCEELLFEYIDATTAHFGADLGVHITHLDVINEMLAIDGTGYRSTVWYDAGGIEIYRKALQRFRLRAPTLKLCIGEYGLEQSAPEQILRRALMLETLADFAGEGLVDCLSVQGHPSVGMYWSEDSFRQFIRDVQALGVEVNITELDCWNNQEAGSNEAIDRQVAIRCEQIVRAWLAEGGGSEFLSWGLNDARSWLQLPEWGGTEFVQRPLLFNDDYRPKQVELAVRRALRAGKAGVLA